MKLPIQKALDVLNEYTPKLWEYSNLRILPCHVISFRKCYKMYLKSVDLNKSYVSMSTNRRQQSHRVRRLGLCIECIQSPSDYHPPHPHPYPVSQSILFKCVPHQIKPYLHWTLRFLKGQNLNLNPWMTKVCSQLSLCICGCIYDSQPPTYIC